MIRARDVLRTKSEQEHRRVTSVELFFDLVFVFAVTQLSHLLLAHLDFRGAVQTGLLLMALWWVWVYTSWVTNWLDPDKTAVRLMLLVLMLAGVAGALQHVLDRWGAQRWTRLDLRHAD